MEERRTRTICDIRNRNGARKGPTRYRTTASRPVRKPLGLNCLRPHSSHSSKTPLRRTPVPLPSPVIPAQAGIQCLFSALVNRSSSELHRLSAELDRSSPERHRSRSERHRSRSERHRSSSERHRTRLSFRPYRPRTSRSQGALSTTLLGNSNSAAGRCSVTGLLCLYSKASGLSFRTGAEYTFLPPAQTIPRRVL